MSTSRRTYHHGDLQASILAAADKMLEKHGVDGLKLRALARRAGVSHNAPYRHFPDREALLGALAAEGFEWLSGMQRKAAASGGLRAMGEAYVRFALEHPQRFSLMFSGQVPIERNTRLRDVATKSFDALSGALASTMPDSQGARDASIAAWALVHGLADLLLEDRISVSARQGREEDAFVRDVLSSIRFVARTAQPA